MGVEGRSGFPGTVWAGIRQAIGRLVGRGDDGRPAI